jgi:hypothetical protein
MSTNIEALLTEFTLHIDPAFEDFAKRFCNTEGFKKEKTKTMFLLDSWFEGYLYCALVGINRGERKKYSAAKKEKSRNWSKEHRDQLAYVLSLIISNDAVKDELKIYDREQIQNTFVNEDDLLKLLKNICDEYANEGLNYLQGEFEKNERLFEDYDALKNIFLKSKIT